MATVQVMLRDGVLLAAQPGVIPGGALDELIRKVRELDMDEVRRSIAEEARAAKSTARAGGM